MLSRIKTQSIVRTSKEHIPWQERKKLYLSLETNQHILVEWSVLIWISRYTCKSLPSKDSNTYFSEPIIVQHIRGYINTTLRDLSGFVFVSMAFSPPAIQVSKINLISKILLSFSHVSETKSTTGVKGIKCKFCLQRAHTII